MNRVVALGRCSAWAVVLLVGLTAQMAGCGPPDPPDDRAPQILTVIDGDTLDLEGQVIELAGVDAPELGQQCLEGSRLYACGLDAAYELKKRVELEPVTCTPAGNGDPGYLCQTADSSLALLLVEDGLALARDGNSLGTAQLHAQQVPLGIWRGPFIDPEAWCDGERLPEERVQGDDCPILGVDIDGHKSYAVPTDAFYAAWEEDAAGVDRHFCSDEEARAQGYSHARAG